MKGLFAPLDKRHRLYVRRSVAHAGLPVPTGMGTLLRALQARSREAPVVPGPAFSRGAAVPFVPAPFLSPSEERVALADLHFRLVERYAPPSIKRPDLPEAVTKTFAMIQRNAELEARFIDDLLDVTRIERGKMEITRADINLYEAIERAVEVSMPDIQAKGQRLTVALEGTTCPYHGDFARLQQVFWNLLKNASKFTPPGGAIAIRSRCQAGDQFVVEITDTGIGLEADAIERIFRPFEQASVTVTREFGGLGLGLAIAKATMDAHGGTLHVRSAGLGQGATFTVRLPWRRPRGTPRKPRPEARPPPPAVVRQDFFITG